MKDDFLHEFREAPRAEFAEALYQQLLEEENNTVSSLSVPLHSINGHHNRQHSPVKNRSLAWIAAIFALMLFGSLLVYMVSSGVPHPVTLTQIQTEISLSDLPPITRENVSQLAVVRQMGSGKVTDIAWSPDGNTLAVAGTFGVWLYDTHAWDTPPLLLPMLPDGEERHLAFSPDGTLLASTDGLAIRLWSTDTWSLVATLEGHTNTVTALAFSPDSSTLASGGGDFGAEDADYTVRLWDAQNGVERMILTDTDGIIQSLAFSPDGVLLATGCWCTDEKSRVWNLQSGERVQILEQTAGAYGNQDIAFSPDGTLLAQGDRWGVNLWNTTNGEQFDQVRRTGTNPPNIQSLAFGSDGQILAFASWNYGINLWDIQAKKFLPRSQAQESLLEVDSLAFNPDGAQIATLTNNNLIQVWDTFSGEELAHIQDWDGPVRTLMSADGQSIVAYSARGGLINIYDGTNGTLRRRIETGLGRIFYHGIAISPDNLTLAYSGWRARVSNAVQIITGSEINLTNIVTDETRPLGEQSKDNYLLAISPDGTHLASASPLTPDSLQIWDMTDPETPISVFPIDMELDPPAIQTPNDIRYSPDGKYLILENVSGEMAVIRADTGETVRIFRQPGTETETDRFHDLLTAISPDGTRLITMYNAPYDTPKDGAVIYTWDLETGEILNTVETNALGIADPVFSPDGKMLLLAMVNKMEILDVATGDSLFRLDTSGILSAGSIAFDPNGRFIVTGGWDGIIRIWGVMPE